MMEERCETAAFIAEGSLFCKWKGVLKAVDGSKGSFKAGTGLAENSIGGQIV
jgi:hypothetical protein